MKLRWLAGLSLLLFVTACNNTFEIGLEHSPAAFTDTPFPGETPVPPTPTLPAPPPTAQAPTDTPLPTAGALVHSVQIFLIAVDDNGQGGTPVGCGDSLIPVEVQIEPTQAVLKAALQALLSVKAQYYGESGLYNALYQSDLQVESLNIAAGKASVYLTGSLKMGGECDGPRVQSQLEATVLQFPTVTEAEIFINGTPLQQALSLIG